jgi:hypothetical protein
MKTKFGTLLFKKSKKSAVSSRGRFCGSFFFYEPPPPTQSTQRVNSKNANCHSFGGSKKGPNAGSESFGRIYHRNAFVIRSVKLLSNKINTCVFNNQQQAAVVRTYSAWCAGLSSGSPLLLPKPQQISSTSVAHLWSRPFAPNIMRMLPRRDPRLPR